MSFSSSLIPKQVLFIQKTPNASLQLDGQLKKYDFQASTKGNWNRLLAKTSDHASITGSYSIDYQTNARQRVYQEFIQARRVIIPQESLIVESKKAPAKKMQLMILTNDSQLQQLNKQSYLMQDSTPKQPRSPSRKNQQSKTEIPIDKLLNSPLSPTGNSRKAQIKPMEKHEPVRKEIKQPSILKQMNDLRSQIQTLPGSGSNRIQKLSQSHFTFSGKTPENILQQTSAQILENKGVRKSLSSYKIPILYK